MQQIVKYISVTYPKRYPCYPVSAPQLVSTTHPGYLLGTVSLPTQPDSPGSAVRSQSDPNRCLWRIQVSKHLGWR